MDFSFKFSAVKGIQAKKEYYIAMVPLNMLIRLFPNDEEYVLPEYRAQRRLNEARIPVIKQYILDNRDTYVFSALAASIDGEHEFVPNIANTGTGILEISMNAKFMINDGQHRKAAIIAALEEDPDLGNETIPVVFYIDMDLGRSQQIFTDLNKHAIKTSNSIAELYDSRDPLAVITRKCVSSISFYDEYVDKEKDNLGKYSSALFTLNTFYMANKRILRKYDCNEYFESFLIKYWTAVQMNMCPWNKMVDREITKKDLRELYIASQSVVIQAFGKLGAYYFEHSERDAEDDLNALKTIDWKRNANIWKMRVVRNDGRMIINERAVMLTSNVLKMHIGIELSDDEQIAEDKFRIEYVEKVGD